MGSSRPSTGSGTRSRSRARCSGARRPRRAPAGPPSSSACSGAPRRITRRATGPSRSLPSAATSTSPPTARASASRARRGPCAHRARCARRGGAPLRQPAPRLFVNSRHFARLTVAARRSPYHNPASPSPQAGFGHFGQDPNCRQCGPGQLTAWRGVGVLALYLGALALALKSALAFVSHMPSLPSQGAGQARPASGASHNIQRATGPRRPSPPNHLLPQVFKLLVTHQVCNSMLLGIPVPWPERVRGLLRSQSILGGAMLAFYSFDCRLESRTGSPFFDRLVVFSVAIPVFAVLVPAAAAYLTFRVVRTPPPDTHTSTGRPPPPASATAPRPVARQRALSELADPPCRCPPSTWPRRRRRAAPSRRLSCATGRGAARRCGRSPCSS